MSADIKTRMDFFAEMLRAGNFSRAALAIAFVLLYRHFNGRTGRCDPSISTLAKEAGLTVRGVKKAIDEIKRSSWWRIGREGTAARGGRTNSYAPQFEVVNYASPVGIESGERRDTSSTAKLVNAGTPVRRESGEQTGKKVVNASTPKPVKNQVRLSLGANAPRSWHRRADARLGVLGGNGAAKGGFDEFWEVYPSRSPHSNPKEPARLNCLGELW
jgi:hypothetical protein